MKWNRHCAVDTVLVPYCQPRISLPCSRKVKSATFCSEGSQKDIFLSWIESRMKWRDYGQDCTWSKGKEIFLYKMKKGMSNHTTVASNIKYSFFLLTNERYFLSYCFCFYLLLYLIWNYLIFFSSFSSPPAKCRMAGLNFLPFFVFRPKAIRQPHPYHNFITKAT